VTTTTVFQERHDGYHTCRIPSLLCTAGGALLAFCEGRTSRHDHSENDIILKRSTDGGLTWGPVSVVVTDGRNSLNNPQAVAVRETGRILLMYQRYPHGFHEREDKDWHRAGGLRSVVPGYEEEPICRSYLTYSDDEGVAWALPAELTRVARFREARTAASGPGIGIELRRGACKGRIVMPFNGRAGSSNVARVYAVYSDDGGESWRRGESAPAAAGESADEVQMVELTDGTVLLNARAVRGYGMRKRSVSRDGAETWAALEDEPALVEPGCMASLIRFADPLDGDDNTLLFCGPASTTDRAHGRIRASHDDGASWTSGKEICTGPFAYSCLARTAEGDLACLYETGSAGPYESIVMALLSPDELCG
jgi:sialidase-1